MLQDTDPMPFGKYKGKPMAQVPASYLFWLEEKITATFYNNRTLQEKEIMAYVKENRQVLEKEITRK